MNTTSKTWIPDPSAEGVLMQKPEMRKPERSNYVEHGCPDWTMYRKAEKEYNDYLASLPRIPCDSSMLPLENREYVLDQDFKILIHGMPDGDFVKEVQVAFPITRKDESSEPILELHSLGFADDVPKARQKTDKNKEI